MRGKWINTRRWLDITIGQSTFTIYALYVREFQSANIFIDTMQNKECKQNIKKGKKNFNIPDSRTSVKVDPWRKNKLWGNIGKKKRFRPDFYFSKKWIRKRFVVVSRAINPGLTKSCWNFAVKVHCSSHKWSLPPLYTDQNQCKKDLDSNIRDTTFVLISMELGQKPRSIWLTIDVRTLCIDTDIHCQSVHQWNPDIGKCILLLNFLFECSWNFSSLVS